MMENARKEQEGGRRALEFRLWRCQTLMELEDKFKINKMSKLIKIQSLLIKAKQIKRKEIEINIRIKSS